MTTPFGPQLIGETEKTLNALLLRFLDGTDLTEPQWVTLRVAHMLDGTVDHDGLVSTVTDRAQFPDAHDLVDQLTARGLLDDGRPTPEGSALLQQVQSALATDTAAIFEDLEPGDVAATERVLNELASRARLALTR
jgi:hypothetical protein